MTHKLLYFFALFFLMWSCISEPEATSTIEADPLLNVLKNGDERNIAAITSDLRSENEAVRSLACQLAASMRSVDHLGPLHTILKDDSANVPMVNAAAFALGQIASEKSVEHLSAALDRTEMSKEYLHEALGKIGSDDAVDELLRTAPSMSSALGVLRAINSGSEDLRLVERAMDLITETRAETRLYAAHALLRQKHADLTPYMDRLSTAIESEADKEVKAALLGALKHTVGGEKQRLTIGELRGRVDRHTFVKSVNALGTEDFLATYSYVLPHLTNSDVHSARTAAKFLDRNFHDALIDHYLLRLDSIPHKEVQVIMLGSLNRMGNVQAHKALVEMASDDAEVYHAAFALQQLGHRSADKEMLLEICKDSTKGVLRGYAYESLLRLDSKTSRTSPETIEMGLTSGDIAMVCLAAGHLRDAGFRMNAPAYFEMLALAEESLVLPRENEALVEISRTKAFLAEEEFVMPSFPTSGEGPELPSYSSSDRPKVKLVTSKGVIVMELRPDKAPYSVSRIAGLVENGYYDGKTFHRVVPDFVAQGGCPRGDGWGSLDWSLRSELSDLRYTEGTVGLASAGSDTEGCQFFITHGPTPHLDGRYTIIAQVVEGMEVAHRLQIGDVIRKAIVL